MTAQLAQNEQKESLIIYLVLAEKHRVRYPKIFQIFGMTLVFSSKEIKLTPRVFEILIYREHSSNEVTLVDIDLFRSRSQHDTMQFCDWLLNVSRAKFAQIKFLEI